MSYFNIYCRFPNTKLIDNSTVNYAQTKLIWYKVISAQTTSWSSYHQEHSTAPKHLPGSVWTVKSPHKTVTSSNKWFSNAVALSNCKKGTCLQTENWKKLLTSSSTGSAHTGTFKSFTTLSIFMKGHESSVRTGLLRLQANFNNRLTLHPKCMKDKNLELSLTS